MAIKTVKQLMKLQTFEKAVLVYDFDINCSGVSSGPTRVTNTMYKL